MFFALISLFCKQMPQDSFVFFNMYLQIGTLTIFVINLMVTLDNYKSQMEDRNNSQYNKCASISQTRINDIDRMFMNNPLLDRLYAEMYTTDKHVQKFKPNNILETPDRLKAEYHACSIIFQMMSTIYMTSIVNQEQSPSFEWCRTLSRWMQSKILRSHWILSFRDEHDPCFVAFVDRLMRLSPIKN
jgi:hypothetical protein